MTLKGNYRIQAESAKKRFLTYDQQMLIRKFGLEHTEEYLFVNLLCKLYRIHRETACFERQDREGWVDANSFEEIMTLLDLLCDSRPDRRIAGEWASMESFGLMFHRNLLEISRDPMAERIQQQEEVFRRVCLSMEGLPVPGADIGYAVTFFDDLRVALQYWRGDEEFPARLRFLWDANAGQYLRYETMHYAVGLLKRVIREKMDCF